MPQFNAAQLRCRDSLKMLVEIKDNALRQKRAAELPPLRIKVADLTPTAYCALMQMKGSMPNATPEQLAEAQRVFGAVIDQATKIAAIRQGLKELDIMGVGVVMPDGFLCYPNIDLLSEVVTAAQVVH